EKGDAQQAFQAASKAADRNPMSARNFYIGGKALCKLDKTDLCMKWLERSVSLDPNYPDPLYLLAKVYGQLGQEQKAKQTLEKFRAVKPDAPLLRGYPPPPASSHLQAVRAVRSSERESEHDSIRGRHCRCGLCLGASAGGLHSCASGCADREALRPMPW